MFPLISGILPAGAAASLSAAISIQGQSQVPLHQAGQPSDPSSFHSTVAASGGSGSYTFAWSLVILDDAGGLITVQTQGGPLNQSNYDSAEVVGGGGRGAPQGVAVTQCVVSDGTSQVTVQSGHYTILIQY